MLPLHSLPAHVTDNSMAQAIFLVEISLTCLLADAIVLFVRQLLSCRAYRRLEMCRLI